jgi:hypothetical protein
MRIAEALKAGRWGEVVELVESSPSSERGAFHHQAMAEALVALGQPDRAREALESYEPVAQSEDPARRLLEARLLADDGRLGEAFEVLYGGPVAEGSGQLAASIRAGFETARLDRSSPRGRAAYWDLRLEESSLPFELEDAPDASDASDASDGSRGPGEEPEGLSPPPLEAWWGGVMIPPFEASLHELGGTFLMRVDLMTGQVDEVARPLFERLERQGLGGDPLVWPRLVLGRLRISRPELAERILTFDADDGRLGLGALDDPEDFRGLLAAVSEAVRGLWTAAPGPASDHSHRIPAPPGQGLPAGSLDNLIDWIGRGGSHGPRTWAEIRDRAAETLRALGPGALEGEAPRRAAFETLSAILALFEVSAEVARAALREAAETPVKDGEFNIDKNL